jgi:hypothetical protein
LPLFLAVHRLPAFLRQYLIQFPGNSLKRLPEISILVNYSLSVRGLEHLPTLFTALVALEKPCDIEGAGPLASGKMANAQVATRLDP